MQVAATCVPGVSLPVNQEAPPDMNGDQALAGKILRKRREEMERRARLLNPRARVHGADLQGLGTQVDDKKAMAAAAVEAEAEDAKMQMMQVEVLESIEEAKRSFRREQHMQTMQYSLQNLTKESRLEYDLSDPQRIKKDTLPKDGIGTDGRPIGPCAMQTFEGDMDLKDLQKKQRLQQKEWLAQQVQEKMDRAAVDKEADMQDAITIMNGTRLREAIEAVEAEDAKQERMELMEANLQIAAAQKAKKEAKKNKEKALHERVISRAMNDERLAEAYDFKLNSAGRLCEYKRASYEQEQEVHDTNAMMVMEKMALKRLEQQEAAETDSQVLAACALMDQLHGLALEQSKERRMKVVEENKARHTIKMQKDAKEKAERTVWLPDGVGPPTAHGKH